MNSPEVRYHKSTEDIDEERCAGVKPLKIGYCRFTVLERILIAVVCFIFILALIFVILYASASRNNAKNKATGSAECLTPTCITISSDILRSVDWSADPCEDFYQYSCGKFLANHEIPDTRTTLDQFSKLKEKNSKFIRKQLESGEIQKKYSKNEAVSKALKDYFSCIKGEERKNDIGLQRALDLVNQYGSCNILDSNWNDSNWQFMTQLANMRRDLGAVPLFFASVGKDLKNSSRNIIRITETYALLQRDGYLSNETISSKRRKLYKDLMLTVMTALANTSKDDPIVSKQVEGIFNFERQLAEITMTFAQAQHLEENYRKISLKELQQCTGKTFNWLDYFQKFLHGVDNNVKDDMVVTVFQLDYLKNMSRILGKTDDVVLGNYLIWNAVSKMSPYLGKEIRGNFEDYFKSIYGTKKTLPSWEFCLISTRNTLGLPLSRLFVDEKFDENQMKQVTEMVSGIQDIFIKNVQDINWMDEETKTVALTKAKTIKQNVGYPKKLLDEKELSEMFKELEIDENDYFGNIMRKNKFTFKENSKKLKKSVDKSRWSLFPDDTNAYYSAAENKIVFPAGVLQSPFFDGSRPKSLNYGAIGMVIGHELTHSFDNRGRKYDQHGNLVNWWHNSSVTKFQKRAKCLEEKYSQYKFHNLTVNGRNNLDENIADNGGIKQAFQAYEKWTKVHGKETDLPGLNVTHHQLFFLGFSQIWCTKYRESVIKNVVDQQRHAPSMIRILGSLSNFPEFAKAFNCPLGSQMNPKKKCDVW